MARITSKEVLNGPINPTLFRMTTPMIIGILVLFTFQTVDTYFISMLGTQELAAISFTLPVTYTITNVAVGLSIGTSILIAKVIGRGNLNEAARITSNSIILTFLIGIGVSALGFVFANQLFRSLGASESTLLLIRQYLDIWLISAPIYLLPMISNGAIRATGDTKWPSLMMMFTGAINVVLDPILIFGLGPFPMLGLRGAALATLIAALFGAGMATYLLHYREKLLDFSWPGCAALMTGWKVIILLCLPIVIANTLAPVLSGIVTAFVANYGEEAVAGFGAGTRFELLFMVLGFALTSSLSPFMAQNLGAGNDERARSALISSIKFIFIFYLGLWVLVYLTAPWLAQVFSSEPAVIESTALYLKIMPAAFAVYGVFIIINTAFNAAQKTLVTMNVSIIRVFVCVAPAAWIGSQFGGLVGLYWGVVIGGTAACLVSWIWVRKIYYN